MNKIFASALMAVAMLGSVSEAEACSNFIVGKKASVDGSVMCSYSADDYGMFQYLCHYPAAKHAKGEMRKIFDWDSNKYHGEIPEAAETYNVIGNINEWQVTIGETTYGGREEMVDSTGIMDYGSLIYVALQRSKTAREAIKVMTTLANTYGYNSEGETFTICDPKEAWIMEMMGKGVGSKGAVWVALRIPDDAICAHANQSRIGKFNMKDKKNVMYAKDVVSFARSKGWFQGKDAGETQELALGDLHLAGERPHRLIHREGQRLAERLSDAADMGWHLHGAAESVLMHPGIGQRRAHPHAVSLHLVFDAVEQIAIALQQALVAVAGLGVVRRPGRPGRAVRGCLLVADAATGLAFSHSADAFKQLGLVVAAPQGIEQALITRQLDAMG